MANFYVDLRELDTTDWRTVMEDNSLEVFDCKNDPHWRVTFLPKARYEPDTEIDIRRHNITSYECICVFGFHHIGLDGPYAKIFPAIITYVGKLK